MCFLHPRHRKLYKIFAGLTFRRCHKKQGPRAAGNKARDKLERVPWKSFPRPPLQQCMCPSIRTRPRDTAPLICLSGQKLVSQA